MATARSRYRQQVLAATSHLGLSSSFQPLDVLPEGALRGHAHTVTLEVLFWAEEVAVEALVECQGVPPS